MPLTKQRLTPDLQRQVVAYIRAGSYPHVAAEAAGIPAEVFDDWLRKGSLQRAKKHYQQFRAAVLAAQAQARLSAEIAVLRDDPKTWLTKGPGKETPDKPGWSGVVKPLISLTDNRSVNLLSDPTSSALITLLLNALAQFPEARKAAVEALNGVQPIKALPAPRSLVSDEICQRKGLSEACEGVVVIDAVVEGDNDTAPG